MRKGTILLLLAAMAFAGVTCLSALGYASPQTNTLEPTDSGAPSAIVMFPLGEKPNPEASAMAPVAFNHLIHENGWEKQARIVLYVIIQVILWPVLHAIRFKALPRVVL